VIMLLLLSLIIAVCTGHSVATRDPVTALLLCSSTNAKQFIATLNYTNYDGGYYNVEMASFR
jgi:hypothetical protein